MKLIYSDVPPIINKSNSPYLLREIINNMATKSDSIICAVGYASQKSLLELDSIIKNNNIEHVTLILGMYCIEGFPENIYKTAIDINNSWVASGIGEIKVTKAVKYHGKIYGFYKSGKLFAAIIGSHNLSSLASEPNNLRQYDLSILVDTPHECNEISDHLNSIASTLVSSPINQIDNATIIRSENTKLNNVEGVVKISQDDVDTYKKMQYDIKFNIPLKVPGIPKESRDFMKSNVNKCYAKGRLSSKTGVVTERCWWETEVIVGTDITNDPNYPKKNVPFYVVTDDGWKFLMRASGDHKKNLESGEDLKILGYWLKGRLVASGIVEPVDSPSKDLLNANTSSPNIYKNCIGVITYEKLKKYGRTSISLAKTPNKFVDNTNTTRDVWFLSFLPKSIK